MKDLEKIVLYIKEEINKDVDAQVESIMKQVDEMKEIEEEKVIEEVKLEVESHFNAIKRKLNSETSKQISKYNRDKMNSFIQKRQEYKNEIFNEAKNRILAFCLSNEYELWLKRKLSKYSFDKKVIVYVKKEDEVANKFVHEFLDCEVINDKISIGGFIIETNTQRICDESFDTALKDQEIWFEEHSQMILQ